ncbi:DUF1272 domain-containing protein [Seohaeicola zhoushanensis]|uniref:Urease n=1 Tax=Seohaeicola zhoushanensis TaxID=1569283 RepID=A0A8J3M311_9RHOB|nr:DUF1272 domain-containing protein [Seohaeicola zhoushanensis]GHF32797.1 urease [Seohaeicola zhoushanensis]
MLELRPNCEICDRDLPPASGEAHICTYECTYCSDCARELMNVCPNCGGNLQPRPIRPATAHRPNVSLSHHPASDKRRHSKWSAEERRAFSVGLKDVPPAER